MEILGHGVYSLPEAAKLTGLKRQRIREWFVGRSTEAIRRPVFRSDYENVPGDRAVSFHDLIELFVAGQLRDHGVSLQTLRRVYGRMQKDLAAQHPFCRSEVLSDGKKVFMIGLEDRGREEMVEVLCRQRVFAEILLPFLKKIAYDDVTRLARKWMIADMVAIDPTICLGKPIVEAVGIATSILASAYHANGQSTDRVAEWYGIHARHVLAAVEFEGSLAA